MGFFVATSLEENMLVVNNVLQHWCQSEVFFFLRKKITCYSRVLEVAELVVSGNQCNILPVALI